jgi:lysyl-tRNA synthetase class 2
MKATRAFFAERKFCEVIPPILNNAIPNEPNLYPFTTSWVTNDAEETRYLPTSPERSLKIALSAGLGDCYAIGHCFRNLEGSGSLHSPEFLMLEWYRVNSSYQEIMKEIQEYIAFVNKQLLPFGAKSLEESLSVDQPSLRPCPQCSRICEAGGGTAILRQAKDDGAVTKQSHQTLELTKYPWQTFSLRERFEKLLGTSYERLVTDDKVLERVAKQRGYTVENASWRQIFDQILVNEIESNLPKDPVFLIDFPSRISPLCKKKSDAPHIAERFELYIGGVEIANGNNEKTNVSEIRTVFEKETGEGKSPLDIQFLEALQKMDDSGNSYAGVGLGLDRLLMVMMRNEEIAPF